MGKRVLLVSSDRNLEETVTDVQMPPPTHRPLSSSSLWFDLEPCKVMPKRNYLGGYGYALTQLLEPTF